MATNKGLMVAAMQCLGCFLTKTECPISVFSRVGKKNITDALVASNPEKDGCIGKNNIPRLFTLLTTELGIKLSLDLQDISGLHEYPVPIKDWPVKSLHQPSLVEA